MLLVEFGEAIAFSRLFLSFDLLIGESTPIMNLTEQLLLPIGFVFPRPPPPLPGAPGVGGAFLIV